MKKLVEVAYAEYILVSPYSEELYIGYNRSELITARRNILKELKITDPTERDLYKINTRYRFLRNEEVEVEQQ